MSKFFIEQQQATGDVFSITGEDAFHISRVLRMQIGETILVGDGMGWDYLCKFLDIQDKMVTVQVLEKSKCNQELPVAVTLYQAMTKGDKMELIVQKAVELGVTSIVPFYSKRCVAKWETGEKGEKKTARFQKIAFTAAKQSERGRIPQFSLPVSFSQAVADASQKELALIPYEEETKCHLRQVISEKPVLSASVLIGPEGGFEKEEVLQAKSAGILPVSLGRRILRTETAGLFVLSALSYAWEEL